MIEIFITGGTFDKEYNEITGTLFFENTHLPKMLERSRCRLPIKVSKLMMKDSLELVDEDRLKLRNHIATSNADQIVVTHGTDTMVETARFIADQNIASKTIILTGAMIPYAFGSSSDGFFNLGCALSFVQCKPNGVYVSMNGQCFDWHNVAKNKEKGFFHPLQE